MSLFSYSGNLPSYIMDKNSFSYDTWLKGKCIIETKQFDVSVAILCFKEYLKQNEYHKESLEYLAKYETNKNEAYRYAMILLKNNMRYSTKIDDEIAPLALKYARELEDEEKIKEALEYNPEEKKRVEEEKRQKEAEEERLMREEEERKRREEEERIKAEKKRKDEELLMVLF